MGDKPSNRNGITICTNRHHIGVQMAINLQSHPIGIGLQYSQLDILPMFPANVGENPTGGFEDETWTNCVINIFQMAVNPQKITKLQTNSTKGLVMKRRQNLCYENKYKRGNNYAQLDIIPMLPDNPTSGFEDDRGHPLCHKNIQLAVNPQNIIHSEQGYRENVRTT